MTEEGLNLLLYSTQEAVDLGFINFRQIGSAQGTGGSTVTVTLSGRSNMGFEPTYSGGLMLSEAFSEYGIGMTSAILPSDAVRACFTPSATDENGTDRGRWAAFADGGFNGPYIRHMDFVLRYIDANNQIHEVANNQLTNNETVQKFENVNLVGTVDEGECTQIFDFGKAGYIAADVSMLPEYWWYGEKCTAITISVAGCPFIVSRGNADAYLSTGVNPEGGGSGGGGGSSSGTGSQSTAYYYNYKQYNVEFLLGTAKKYTTVSEKHYKDNTTNRVCFYKDGDYLRLKNYSASAKVSPDGESWETGMTTTYQSVNTAVSTVISGNGYTWSGANDTSWTNIPIFNTEADADEYIAGQKPVTDSNNATIIAPDLSEHPVIGSNEGTTSTGRSGMADVFTHQYILNNTALRDVSEVIFTTDATDKENLMKGIDLWGQSAINALISLYYYPFDVSNICSYDSTNTFSVGTYSKSVINTLKQINNVNSLLEMGSVTYNATYNDYRDYEPYTRLIITLPYVGVHELEIAKYINKTIRLAYAVDVTTGACMAILFANNVIMDTFQGVIGTQMPITSIDQATYAGNLLKNDIQYAGATLSNIVTMGASVGTGNYSQAINSAINQGMADTEHSFQNAQIEMTKPINLHGSFTSSLSMFDRQYATFTVATLKTVVPTNEKYIVGLPSNQGGNVSDFTGYLECSDVYINTTATPMEIDMIKSMLKTGIYI